MKLINAGEYTQFGRVFGPMIYMYIGGIFALSAIGFWIQTNMIPENPANVKKEEVKAEDTTKTAEENKGDKAEIKKEDGEIKETKTHTEVTEKKEEVKNEDKKTENQ